MIAIIIEHFSCLFLRGFRKRRSSKLETSHCMLLLKVYYTVLSPCSPPISDCLMPYPDLAFGLKRKGTASLDPRLLPIRQNIQNCPSQGPKIRLKLSLTTTSRKATAAAFWPDRLHKPLLSDRLSHAWYSLFVRFLIMY